MIIEKCVQGDDSWWACKLGVPSASNINKITTTTGKKSTQRDDYMNTLVAERITGKRDETGFKSSAMEVGNEREEESRKMYSLVTDADIEQVGVIYKNEDKKFLCSPDGIAHAKGSVFDYGLELKNVLPKTQIKRLRANKQPTEYIMQIQFSLYVTGFKRWDFCSYSPGLRPLIISVERDEKLILIIETEIKKFCEELETLVKELS